MSNLLRYMISLNKQPGTNKEYERRMQNDECFRDYERLYNDPTNENLKWFEDKHGEDALELYHFRYGLNSVEYMKKNKKCSFKNNCFGWEER